MAKLKFRTLYDEVPFKVRCGEDPGESLTHQSFAEDCDINRMIAKAQRGGFIATTTSPPMYGDFPAVDFKSAMDSVLSAQASFDALPAKVRRRFGNDPGALLDFIGDESNRDEAIALGLIDPPADAAAGAASSAGASDAAAGSSGAAGGV